MKRIKLVIINHGFFFAGGERSLMVLVQSLDKSKYEIIVGTGSGSPLIKKLKDLGIETYDYAIPNKSILSTPKRIQVILGFLIKTVNLRPDIIHANSLTMSYLAGVLSLFGFKTVGHVRDIVPITGIKRLLLGKNNLIIANSKATQRLLMDVGITNDKIHVVYNGVNLKEFDSTKLNRRLIRSHLKLKISDVVLGVIGSYNPRKNQLWVIESLSDHIKDDKNIKLLLVGPVDDKNYFLKINESVKKLGLEESVIVLENRDDIAAVMNACDLIILASTQEPFGRVLIEAMALGKPVIGTNVGGIPEIITKSTGFLIKLGDKNSLVKHVEELINNKSLYEFVSKKEQTRAEKIFSDTVYAKNIGLLYNILLGSTKK